MMKLKPIFLGIWIAFSFLLLNSIVHATTPSITIEGFDVTPKGIPYSTASTLTYTFSLSTPSASATKDYCSTSINFANGDINWAVIDTNSAQTVTNGTILADDFASSLHVSKISTFSYTPTSNQTVANFQLIISCHGSNTFGQITKSALVPINITGQTNKTGVTIAFGSDKTDQHVTPNTQLKVTFQFDITSSEAALKSRCGTNTNDPKLAYSIYEFSTALPGDRSNVIFTSAISFSSFGTGSTEKNTIPISVNIPGNDIGFVGQVRCNGTSQGESSQITIYAGGAGTGPTSNGGTSGGSGTGSGPTFNSVGATSTKSYSFDIKNPLNGGPNNLFDIIDIVTKLLLQISIPIAVIMILYAGFLMLTAGAIPAKFEQGKKILMYTVAGLAVIFIGRGFITLIYSIIELGGSGTPTSQTQQDQNISNQLTAPNGTECINNTCQNTGLKCTSFADCQPIAGLGDACAANSCNPGLVCNTICQRRGGNGLGEPCQQSSNCVSNACSTAGGGTCVANPTTGGTGSSTGSYAKTLEISMAGATTGKVGEAYSATLSVSNPVDSSQGYSWAVVSGSFPPGLSLDVNGLSITGLVVGTPTKAGSYSVTIQALDPVNKVYSQQKVSLTITQ